LSHLYSKVIFLPRQAGTNVGKALKKSPFSRKKTTDFELRMIIWSVRVRTTVTFFVPLDLIENGRPFDRNGLFVPLYPAEDDRVTMTGSGQTQVI